MIALAALPFVVGVLLAITGRRLGRRLPPAAATWILTGLSLTVALTCGLVLSAFAVVSIAQLPMAAHTGHWSAAVLHREGSPPVPLGIGLAVIVAILLGASAQQVIRSARAMASSRAALRGYSDTGSNLVVVHDDDPAAYAVGAAGRIVVSTGMLRALSTTERRVLLAHEAAHLRYRHYLFVQLTDLAAAANPLLRPVSGAVRSSIERWADEAAAAEVGDRRLAARGLARAALSKSTYQPVGAVFGIADGDVAVRVRALLVPAPAFNWNLRLALVSAGILCWATSMVLTFRAHDVIEIAQSIHGH